MTAPRVPPEHVVEARLGSTGRRSGAETDRDVAFLYTFDDQGLIASARLFRDTEEALAAAGR